MIRFFSFQLTNRPVIAVNFLKTKVQHHAVTMTTTSTIVFGPTGAVASAAARTAHEHGAKVYLAMRDPQKAIPGLNPEHERGDGFERVQADLLKPDTVHAAVKKTGAKHAFIYMAPGSPDHMKSTISALKSAGIGFVVFLSSFSIQDDIKMIPQSEFIAFAHAQVEINLEEVFGVDGFVAVRPAWFASNALWWKTTVRDGEVKIAYPDAKADWITPGDIGAVCGMLLARGLQGIDGADKKNFVNLCGPEMLSLREAMAIIAKAIGKDVEVTQLDEQGGVENFVKVHGFPEPVAKYLINALKRMDERTDDSFHRLYEEGAGNLRKYAGRLPTSFQQWVEENKQEFGA